MKRMIWMEAVAVAILAVISGAGELQSQVSIRQKPKIVPGEVVIKYKSDGARAMAVSSLQALGVTVAKSSPHLPYVIGKFSPQKNLKQVLRDCRALPNVEYAEPNYWVYAIQSPSVTPNDPRFSEQWNMNNNNDADIDAPEAWTIQTGSNELIVGIIDTGIDYDHEDLADNIWLNPGETGNGKEKNGIDDDGNGYIDDYRGWNFESNSKDPYDNNGHGTHCAGIVGAEGNNGVGVAGVNWRVKLMALKFLGPDGSGTTEHAAEAIIYATKMGAKILSNSWGGGENSRTLQDAIQYASDNDVLFIAASGNEASDNDRTPNYPANYDVHNVVSVASSDRNDNLSSFSNYGRRTVDLAAPGSGILSNKPNKSYQVLSGTSMAAPHVAGVCALVWAQYPRLTAQQVLIRVLGSVDRLPSFSGRVASGGRLNAAKALATAAPLIAYTTQFDHPDSASFPYQVKTAVMDDDSVVSVRLLYALAGTSGDSLSMKPLGKDFYSATIPAQGRSKQIFYQVVAIDNAGNRTASPIFSIGSGGGCGQSAASIQGLDSTTQSAIAISFNLLFFLLPVLLLRRKKPRD